MSVCVCGIMSHRNYMLETAFEEGDWVRTTDNACFIAPGQNTPEECELIQNVDGVVIETWGEGILDRCRIKYHPQNDNRLGVHTAWIPSIYLKKIKREEYRGLNFALRSKNPYFVEF